MRARAVMTALWLLVSLCHSGCTVAGYLAGNAIDHAGARAQPPTIGVLRAACGREVVLQRRDGSTVHRRLVRLDCHADTSLVLEPYRPTGSVFAADVAVDSLRIARGEVMSLTILSTSARSALVGLGLTADLVAFFLLRAIGTGVGAIGALR